MSRPLFPPHAVAVIGMAGRFPKSPTLEAFWGNVRDGVECLTRFSDEELAAAGIPDAIRRQPGYVPVRGQLADADRFDAGFFGISPREAELIDPQQRLLLECAVEAFEDAGYDWSRTSVPVGVFAGVGANAYLFTQIAQADLSGHPGAAYEVFTGNDKDFCATRLSYKLGLRGPSVNVQTACSTSLVAVHMACQALLNYQCDMALAGAASLLGGRAGGYLYAEGMILSPDGHCRPFDADARGTVPGEGVGLVMLKRLEDALADRDTVRAVIIGSGVNNDGSLKAGFTAPSVDGQREAIGLAMAMADVVPDEISYIETHGTATPLGDPIEIAALTQAFREQTSRRGFCALGALKGNIGHTDTVAGVAGLIKAVLALEHRVLPPTLHHRAANPALHLDDSPFFVNTALRPWETEGAPRRAGVSSFGIGGTNAHAILQEAPAREPRVSSRRVQVMTLSARSEAALDAATRRIGDAIAARPDLSAADAAFTLQQGRHHYAFRRTIQGRSLDELARAIATGSPDHVRIGRAGERAPQVVFMFSGQGAQYPGMGADLYANEPVFRQAIDECADALAGVRDEDLRDVMLRATGDAAADRLRRTLWAQPALFAIDYAIARLWIARGVEPAAMIGHSLGEYVAATVAGAIEPAAAMRLVAERARLMDLLPGGSMMAVPLAERDALPLLPPGVALAAVNGPALVVASGPTAAIDDLERTLTARGLTPRRLHTSHAFHSPMVEPMLEPFSAALRGTSFSTPRRRVVSNVTGTWLDDAQAPAPEYWLDHVRRPVRFSDGIALLSSLDDRVVFLEVGPGRTLATLARQQIGASSTVVTSLRHADERGDDEETFAAATASLWRSGVAVDWPAVHAGDNPCRVPLPSYPFERERFWIEAAPSQARANVADRAKAPVADWFTVPTWQRVEATFASQAPADERWVVFDDEKSSVAAALRSAGVSDATLVVVRAGAACDIGAAPTVRPDVMADYDVVLGEAVRRIGAPTRIVHAFGATAPQASLPRRSFDAFHAALALAQAIANRLEISRARIDFVVAGSASVTGSEVILPDRAAVHGLARVIPQEYQHLQVSVVDLATDGARVDDPATVTGHLFDSDPRPLVAVRGRHRWGRVFEPVACPSPDARPRLLDADGAYLVTGAFGNIGAQLCAWLVDEGVRRIALTGRRAVSSAGTTGPDDRVVDVERLRARGVDVLVLQADMADPEQARRMVERVTDHFGSVTGIFHCAGAVRAAALPDLTMEECESQFGAKCHGLWTLLDALAGAPPEFVACTSSISVALGGLGFGAYAASNAALDASVEAFPGHRLISIGWDSWDSRDAPGAFGPLAITPDEGRDAWRRILDGPRARVVVSTTDLVGRMRRWRPLEPAAPAAVAPKHTRPSLSVAYAEPGDDIERKMVAIWEELLGITGIGVHDNFFELGGHSLLGTQLISRLREHFAVQVPLRTIFDASTVQALARHVGGLQWAASATSPATDMGAADREEVEL